MPLATQTESERKFIEVPFLDALGRSRTRILVLFNCKECGKHVERRKSECGTFDYCSQECMVAARSRKIRGEAHHNWKGGKTPRGNGLRGIIDRLVRERGACEECGSTKRLHGHHREHFAVNHERRTDPTNIAVLCASCHAEKHPGLENLIDQNRPRLGEILECAFCGSSFYRQPCVAAISKYCSKECMDADFSLTRATPRTRSHRDVDALLSGWMGVI